MLKLIQNWTLSIFIVYILFLLAAMAHEDGQGISLKMKWKIFEAITTQKMERVNHKNKP